MFVSGDMSSKHTTSHLHNLIKKCTTASHLKQIHAHILTTGLVTLDFSLLGRLFSSSANTFPTSLHYSILLFNQLPHPTIFFHNTLIKLHSKSTLPLHAIPVYTQILSSHLLPDIYTYPFLLKACTQAHAYPQGCSVHAHTFKFALNCNLYVVNALIHFYSTTGSVIDARSLFNMNVELLDVVSWNSMISGYVRIGDICNARILFDEMPVKNEVSWTALITGYVQCGLSKEALGVFERMQVESINKPNEVTLVSVLSACAHLGALEQGKWVQGYMKSHGMEVTVFLGTAMIDMYAKCGEVELGLEVFNCMKQKNLLTWSTLIKGLAMHGRGEEALSLFSDMETAGIVPDDIIFIGVLCACTHAGLVDQGRRVFDLMSRKYGISPKIEHYGCMVDLLARGGLLDEAKDMIDSMPMEPDALIWGALMAGCRFYQNVELAEYAGKHLIQLEPGNAAVYVLLSNIYAASGRKHDAIQIRGLMEKAGASKTAGCSLIEIKGRIHQFIVGDIAHPQIREILHKWEEIEKLLNLGGYIPNKIDVMLDIDEEDKEGALARHSEKLAIAFGLISTADGAPIRIVKNLRVCHDCHHVTN